MPDRGISKQKRQTVRTRAKGCCEYCKCQEAYASYTFSMEHILPKAKEGGDDLANLALACQGCNSHKATFTDGLDPLTREMVPLFDPRKDDWADHFSWSPDSTHIIGLTPGGRATVARLRLNRQGLVNARALLHELGIHPPR